MAVSVDLTKALDKAYEDKSIAEILAAPPSALAGLTEKHDAALAEALGINTIADLFADPQFIARGMRIDPQGTPGLRTPIVMSESRLSLERRSPKLGEHQAEVLREIGLE